MLPLDCPACFAHYEVHESKEGLFTKCLCGKKLQVPVIPNVIVVEETPSKITSSINKFRKSNGFKILKSLEKISLNLMYLDAGGSSAYYHQ